MQVLITHGSLARTRVLSFTRTQLLLAALAVILGLSLLSGAVYHYIFLKAAREGWPVVSQLVRLVARDENAQRDRFLRENLDAMAQRVGEMQAKLIKLEAMGERVSALAGIKIDDIKAGRPAVTTAPGGRGGPYLPVDSPSLGQLQTLASGLEDEAAYQTDLFTFYESRLLESRLKALMIPSSAPVEGPVGSGFGFRPDPMTGRNALHTGLDYPADVGTPIYAAAAGLVTAVERQVDYGQVLEIDHGNGLATRYAHVSRYEVALGAPVKRGQLIARVGTTGRSTGPHLHFEVLVGGAPQDPARFLAGSKTPVEAAARQARR